ncbi:MAG: hypothetical protein GF308_08895 [Candidatus Heimdallarchaeota archaeon]|nr:hypothetical protein [Candidatus Heimdallarchaeota archaeon]
MAFLFGAAIDHWITDFDTTAIVDIVLESLTVVGFLFLLGIFIFALRKAPILLGHGSIEIIVFIFLGLASVSMDVFDEFAWFTSDFYNGWKFTKDFLLLLGALVLVIGFFRFFLFSARLFGVTPEPEEENL